jgi:hypothetical protein
MLAVLIVGPARAADDTVRLAYDAYIGPFYVVSAEADLELSGDRYKVVTRAKSQGMASWFFEWRSEARTEGGRVAGTLRPRRHEVDGQWRGKLRKVRLDYPYINGIGDGGNVKFDVSPPPDRTERDPVPPPLTKGTIDPLSATLTVLLRMAEGGRCDGAFRVFDGRRRYDMSVSPGEQSVLPRLHSSVFAGAARRCNFQLKRIAGFWKKRTDFRRPVTEPTLWVASPMPNVPPVPVRFTADTGFGELRIHLVRVQRGEKVIAVEGFATR